MICFPLTPSSPVEQNWNIRDQWVVQEFSCLLSHWTLSILTRILSNRLSQDLVQLHIRFPLKHLLLQLRVEVNTFRNGLERFITLLVKNADLLSLLVLWRHEALVMLRLVGGEAPIAAFLVIALELQHSFGVGVEGCDCRGHATSKGGPGHTAGEKVGKNRIISGFSHPKIKKLISWTGMADLQEWKLVLSELVNLRYAVSNVCKEVRGGDWS